MNKLPIDAARDADLRLSAQALRRAAQRAREIARQTGTAVIVSRGGVVEALRPPPAGGVPAQEPTPPYGEGKGA